ncbi:MAG: hypothetical protein U1A27_06880 [Phycisphaerae bacterium]
MRRRPFFFGTTALIALAGAGCNVRPFTDTFLLVAVAPQVFVVTGPNRVVDAGQMIGLDASQSGVSFGNGAFLSATDANLTFTWEIVSARDRATQTLLDIGATGATLMHPNSTDPTFMSPTPADYTLGCTATNGILSGQGRTGVRVN